MVVVVLAGLLLGGALAHFFGRPKNAPAPSQLPVAVLPSPVATVTPVASASPTPIPSPSPINSPSTTPAASPTPRPVVRPTATPIGRAVASQTRPPLRAALVAVTHAPSPAPTSSTHAAAVVARTIAAPAAISTQKAVATAPSAIAAPATGEDRAASLVRSYLEALSRGDRTSAASYLANGTPSETFMNAASRIESIRSTNLGPQQYRVTADVASSSGEYYITFTVESAPGGLAITDHYAIKPQ